MNHEFFFACEPKQPRSHSRAFTYSEAPLIVLYPLFFGKIEKKAEKLKVEDAKKMVDNAIEEDRKAYDQYAKKPDCFPPPESARESLDHSSPLSKTLILLVVAFVSLWDTFVLLNLSAMIITDVAARGTACKASVAC